MHFCTKGGNIDLKTKHDEPWLLYKECDELKKSLRLRIVPNFGEQSELGWVLLIWEEQDQAKTKTGGSVGWASGCHAGGHEFEWLRPDQHSVS